MPVTGVDDAMNRNLRYNYSVAGELLLPGKLAIEAFTNLHIDFSLETLKSEHIYDKGTQPYIKPSKR